MIHTPLANFKLASGVCDDETSITTCVHGLGINLKGLFSGVVIYPCIKTRTYNVLKRK